jgi:hypothetical protein|tara:strand:+ start:32 stop:280 length:249 start_codon:yes stop_codon:yes gene_type:complete
MENINIDEYLEGAHADDAIQLEELDYAVVGTSGDGYLVYDYNRMIECYVADDDMTVDEAIDWIDYNVASLKGFVMLYSYESI